MTTVEQEQLFQDAMTAWDNTNEKRYKDIIWERVFEACKSNASKIMTGLPQNVNFMDRVIQATETCIRNIFERGQRPRKLITFCYYPTLAAMQGPKAMAEDGLRKDRDGNVLDRDLPLDSSFDVGGDQGVLLTDIVPDNRYDTESSVLDRDEKVINCLFRGKRSEFRILKGSKKCVIELNGDTIFTYDRQRKTVLYIDNPEMKEVYMSACALEDE